MWVRVMLRQISPRLMEPVLTGIDSLGGALSQGLRPRTRCATFWNRDGKTLSRG